MKITVERSGGIAALTRTWTVQPETAAATRTSGSRIVEACPWDAVPKTVRAASAEDGQPAGPVHVLHPGRQTPRGAARSALSPVRGGCSWTCARAAAEDTALRGAFGS